MDTKLRVNRYSFRFKAIAFFVSLLGVLAMLAGVVGIRDVFAFISKEDYAVAEYFGDRYLFANDVVLAYFNEDEQLNLSTGESLEREQKIAVAKQRVEEGLDKGYRYFLFAGNEEIAGDNRHTKVDSFASYQNKELGFHRLNFNYYYAAVSQDGRQGQLHLAVTDEAFDAAMTAATPAFERGRLLFYAAIAGFVLFIAGLIWIGKFAGRSPKEEGLKIRFFHRIYDDFVFYFYCAATVGFAVGTVSLWASMPINIEAQYTVTAVASLLFTLFSAWAVACFSVRAKRHELFKYTAFYKFFSWLFRGIAWVARGIVRPFKALVNKNIKSKIIASAIVFLVLMWGYSVVAFVLASEYNTGVLFMWILFVSPIITAIAVAAAFKFFAQFSAIRNGVGEIRNGNLLHKIPPCKNSEFNQVAEDINNLGEGLEAAVSTAISSERMKTELITNVSHDLKTPLTSIVSYVDLLEKEELSAEARDYVAVLKAKAERLKAIISDLFDLSKSSSGNAELLIERLDLSKLIQQTLADMEDKISASGLVIKTTLPEGEVMINADGKKLYRVFQNIIDNALKYSLSGTRIFILLESYGSRIKAELKNTAGYEMDFSEQEILERFSRGDKSRGTEGTGLGLSIAESFTKICGGSFGIKIDGDQFKVKLEFNREN